MHYCIVGVSKNKKRYPIEYKSMNPIEYKSMILMKCALVAFIGDDKNFIARK